MTELIFWQRDQWHVSADTGYSLLTRATIDKLHLFFIPTFLDPPSITVQPKSKTLFSGQSVNFTCEAEGPPPIKLAW